MNKLIRAFFFLPVLIISWWLAGGFFATVTIGAWVEDAAKALGFTTVPGWLLGSSGVLLYIVFGICIPAYLSSLYIGWVGIFGGPLLALGAIALAGRW